MSKNWGSEPNMRCVRAFNRWFLRIFFTGLFSVVVIMIAVGVGQSVGGFLGTVVTILILLVGIPICYLLSIPSAESAMYRSELQRQRLAQQRPYRDRTHVTYRRDGYDRRSDGYR